MKYEDLTIGTIIELKNKEQYMIIGYNPKDDNQEYDYACCKHPEGLLLGGIKPLNNEDVYKVIFNGFNNPFILEALSRKEAK